jgi:hypothetical protein
MRHLFSDIANGETTGTCQTRKVEGEDCVFHVECASGLVCIGAEVNPDTQKVTRGSCGQPLQDGGACNPAAPSTECDYELICNDSSDTCTPYHGLGDTCVYGMEPKCIGHDLYCDSLEYGVEGTCREQKDIGATCTDFEECKSLRCIDGTCQPDDLCAP